ncbi:hypothetical protein ACFSQT_15950 [Mesorhizobium calcicola]|uniref:SDR family oxidoreductase n=1 Tax=Mesorhizobium calcicola TaxID=1300310 RepID=A0ABW4WGI4_9HYPH
MRVNAVCPGEIDTPMLRSGFVHRGFDPATAVAELSRSNPLGRLGEPENNRRCDVLPELGCRLFHCRDHAGGRGSQSRLLAAARSLSGHYDSEILCGTWRLGGGTRFPAGGFVCDNDSFGHSRS